eukprot:CAMPEP_0202018022 /NCGR_PEP_ID=MMETSP0905-20130828/38520_1 /ASSEMBLY_ACC=CAM_ASM_000554 /TAXON_ID=420261 /ORGANISM="Thalassiosira antarctica, Strain CCMP982" /LENGTH=92 /DNA_ID=CAMNT_0048578851 /DNA_START=1 /DNA_END=276 /DNA_ORIENTATION=+
MITESLFEFMDDEGSKRRLIYELAITAEGTYKFRRAGGGAVQIRHIEHRPVWMTLLELPSAKFNGKLIPHGRFLLEYDAPQWVKGDTNCSVE